VSLSKPSGGDQEAPTVTAPDNIVLKAPDDAGLPATDAAIAGFLNGATALDDVDGQITDITNDAPTQFPIGVTTVTFSATDQAGNTGTAQATVTISAPQDNTAPVLNNGRPSGTLPAGTTQVDLQVTTNEPATCRWSDTASTAYADMAATFDTTGGTSHSTTIDGLANGQSYTRYVRCMDAENNANSDDYTISWDVAVEDQDIQAPVVTAPADLTLTAPDSNGLPATDAAIAAFLSGATAVDDVDGEIKAITNDAPAQLPIGVTTVTFSATDQAGNTGTAHATVTINAQQDATAPVLSDGSPSGTFDAGTTQVTMRVSTDEPATCRWSDAAGTAYADMAGAFTTDAGGTGHSTVIDGLADGQSYTRYVRCADANANANTDDFAISWDVAAGNPRDDQAPVVTAPADLEVTAADDTGLPATNAAIVTFLSSATAMDDVDGSIGVISNDAPSHFPMGATTVTFSATDSAGNTGSAQATVTVLSPNDPAGTDTTGNDGGSGSDSSSGCFIGSMAMQP